MHKHLTHIHKNTHAGAEWADKPTDVEEDANEEEEVIDEIMTAGARRTMEAQILKQKKVCV